MLSYSITSKAFDVQYINETLLELIMIYTKEQ